MNKHALITIIFLLTLIFSVQKASALTITCNPGVGCHNESGGTLINAETIFPLWQETKEITVNNNNEETRLFALRIKDNPLWDDLTQPLEKVLRISITDKDNNTILINNETISDFKDRGVVQLSNIAPKSTKIYEVLFSMDNVGNEYQNKKIQFDLTLGFETQEQEEGGKDTEDDDDDDKDSNTSNRGGVTINITQPVTTLGTTTFLPEVSGIAQELSDIPPEDIKLSSVDLTGETVAGAAVCQELFWWGWVLLIQFVIQSTVYLYDRKYPDFKKATVPFQVVSTAIIAFILWKYFCPPYDYIISILQGVVFTYSTLRNKEKRIPQRI